MFWGKKKASKSGTQNPGPTAAEPPPQRPRRDPLDEAAESLAQSLSEYERAAWEASKDKPDTELEEGRRKLQAARKVVEDGRLGFALGRCIPEHIKYWASWSKREDFQKWVGFDATEIDAREVAEKGRSRDIKTLTVDFVFQERPYRIVLRDLGMSSAPGDYCNFGDIELWVNGERTAHFDLIDDNGEYPHWRFLEVRGLRVGPWIRDVLDISTQIEANDRRRRDEYSDNRAREAGKNIDLG